LYWLFVWPPPNIFSHLNIPLSTPTETMRSFINSNSPRHRALEQLVTRMGSFETRTFYVRFGHTVVATCEHCHSFTDFAIYAIPGFLLSYIKQAAVIGVVTIRGTGKERYRSSAVGFVVLAAIAEAYWISTVQIRIPNHTNEGVIMWHDNLTLLRNIAFIIFPIFLHFALPPRGIVGHPGPQPVPISGTAARQITALQSLINKLQLLKYTRGAVSRSPVLSTSAQSYWQTERQEGTWVREDPIVRDVARRTVFGFDDMVSSSTSEPTLGASAEEDPSKLKKFAKNAIKVLSAGYVPSEYWQPSPQPSVVVKQG